MFEKLKAWVKHSYSRSFTNWFGIADWEDGKNFNINNTYLTNAYVNIAINKIATNIVRAKLQLVNDAGVVVESGPVHALFRDVNSMMSTSQLIEATVSWTLMRGEAIWILAGRTTGTITGVPVEITVVDPHLMFHILNKEENEIILWKFKKGSVEIPFSPSEVIHFKQWNPVSHWRGINPLIAMEPELVSDMLINQSNNSLLKNRGVPAGLLTTEESITEEQATEIRDMWDKAHGGSSKTGKTAVLGEGTSYTQLALTGAEMEYFKSKKWNRSAILGRHGVPAIVAGYKDDTVALSGSDTNEQLKFFWEQTLIPLLKFFEDKLDTEFSKRFSPNLHIRFDISEIAELQADLELLAKREREDVKAGILFINEVRESRGKAPVPWGDTWWKNLVFVDVTAPLIPAAAVQNKVEPPVKNSLTIFNKPEPTGWPELFVNQHIWKVKEANKILSNKLYSQLKTWLYDQRKTVLEQLANNGNMNDKFWIQQHEILNKKMIDVMESIRETVIDNIEEIVDLHSYDGISLDFINHGVCNNDYAISRMSNYVTDFVSAPITSRDIDETRNRYKITQARLHEIADREIETIVNDMRTKIFKTLNLDKSLWIQLDKITTTTMITHEPIIPTPEFYPIEANKTVPKKAQTIIEKNKAIVAEAVDEFYDEIDPKVDSAINKADSQADLIAFFVGLNLGSAFVKHMKPTLETVWVNGAKNIYSQSKTLYDLSIKKSAAYIKSRGLLLKKSPQVVTDSVINFIENAGTNRSVTELAGDIIVKWKDVTANRAFLIAQTETTEALSNGAEEAMIELEIEFKRWVNMGDGLVRDEHQDGATGIFAKVGENFKNGLRGPSGFNCRCWLEAATEEEAGDK